MLASVLYPPQTIISLPVHTAVWSYRGMGAFVVLVGAQPSVAGSYLAPSLKSITGQQKTPAQTIISLPVHTALWAARPSTLFGTPVAVQLSVSGLYLPPVFK